MAKEDPSTAAERLSGLAAGLADRLARYGAALQARPLETKPVAIARDVRLIGSLARVAKSILLFQVIEDKLAKAAVETGPEPSNDDVEPAPVSAKKTLPHEDPERAARLYARLDARVADLAQFFESKGVARGPVPGRLGREAERVGWREPPEHPNAPA